MSAPLLSARDRAYLEATDPAHRKALGQYFTPPAVAQFLAAWACRGAATVLDPAAGNSRLLCCARQVAPDAALTGYERDPGMLAFFGNPAGATLHRADYLADDWESKYDAILCNPPYLGFRGIPDRLQILDCLWHHTGVRYSRYTNLALFFLLKGLWQLAPGGRLAYILPAEFLDAQYGTPIKELLVRQGLLRAVINFPHDREIFPDAITTCCILLADRAPKQEVGFYAVQSMEELANLPLESLDRDAPLRVPLKQLQPYKKWHSYLWQETDTRYAHLTTVSRFCTVTRGVATGANDYFCFSRSRMEKENIPPAACTPCICRSANVETPVFTADDFEALARQDRTVYLLDVRGPVTGGVADYLARGEAEGIPGKYLPSIRHPWYAMEQKPPAPIWMTTASRGRIKFVRNLAGAQALTTFHLFYCKEPYTGWADLLFCYFLTPIAQELLRRNRKSMGNGLQKYQPGDCNRAAMLDLQVVSAADRQRVESLYTRLRLGQDPEEVIEALNTLFARYLQP